MSAAASAFPGIDRDVAVTGALLHDIGKTQAYNDDPLAIDLTDAGRLQGEIPLGYYLVRATIESIEGFDRELAQAMLHIILSHHGTLRERLAGGPGDARGDPRARDRQPRRQARAASTASSASCPTARPGRASTAASTPPRTSARAPPNAPRYGENLFVAGGDLVDVAGGVLDAVEAACRPASSCCLRDLGRIVLQVLRLADRLVDLRAAESLRLLKRGRHRVEGVLGRVEDRLDDEEVDRAEDRHGGDDLEQRVEEGAGADHSLMRGTAPATLSDWVDRLRRNCGVPGGAASPRVALIILTCRWPRTPRS